MLIGLFKNKNPLEYVFLLFYTFLFYGILFFKVNVSPVIEYSFLSNLFKLNPAIIPSNYLIVISIIMAYIQTVLFFGLIRKFGLTTDHSLISAYIYITLTGFYPGMIIISPSSISFFVLIFAIYNLFLIYDIESPLQKFFFVSFYLGACSLFFSPMIIFLLFLILALPALKTPTIREFMIIIIGFLMPIYFLTLYYFLTDQLPLLNNLFLENIPNSIFSGIENYHSYVLPVIYVVIIFLMSLFKIYFQSGSSTIRMIIYNRILITCIFISIVAFIMIPSNRWLVGPYILAPASVYIGNMFADDSRKIFNQVAFSLLFLLAVYTEYIFYTL